MDTRVRQRKTDRIEQVVAQLSERWDAAERDQVEAFVRAFYRGVPPADVADASAETLYGAAIAVWRFSELREPGHAKVRVYTPTSDEHGWDSPHTVVEIVNADMPFLVDSVTAELQHLDAEVALVIHPLLDVARDAEGHRVAIGEAAMGHPGVRRESWMQIQVRAQPHSQHAEMARAVESALADVRAAVEDWAEMLERTHALAAELRSKAGGDGEAEDAAFLEWLTEDFFTFLGYREYAFTPQDGTWLGTVLEPTGLGLLRASEARVFDGLLGGGLVPPDVVAFLGEPDRVRVTKANRRSTVHRPVLLDTISVKRLDDEGRVVGCHVLVGLFASRAYAASPWNVPILRQKVGRVLARANVPPDTHDGRALLHILTSFPRDELFQITESELEAAAFGILDLQERPRIALFARADPFERFVSCLVFAPRERYDTALRLRFQDVLTTAWRGHIASYHTQLDDSPLVRLHFTIETTPGQVPVTDVTEVEDLLVEAGRSWGDRLQSALVEVRGEEQGIRWFRRYGQAFPAAYRETFHAHEAVADVAHVEAALANGGLALNLYRPLEAPEHLLHFKIYALGAPLPLSNVLPMLENMGFLVLGEEPYRLRPTDLDRPFWIRDLVLETAAPGSVDLDRVRGPFHEAFAQLWKGELENDGFNRLVLLAGLSAREVTVLRAYCKYLRQARMPFSQAYVEQTLSSEPEIAKRLVDLFYARLDPERRDGGATEEGEIVEEVRRLLDRVSNLDMDRIIRRYLETIGATLRTNYFQPDASGAPKAYLSFKLDSRRITSLPQPRPYREIFVYSPRVEAVHLRGGKVARGGIRWSDRPEDFRTEVLGLMKAQMVKNAVIVPVGSKGGFFVKRPPAPDAGREALTEEVVACYRTLMRGLLDLTDNLEGAAVRPPLHVVRHDEDDPYLVVAADKGTATFSDIANGISSDYGFWLDDAFASGGSAGYDHKKMGITARGAWECVRRHFREMGKDIQSEDFTVVGVGDMSGDVFGNGMLLSEHIRLLGAFDHRHVFVDPDPDPAASLAERRRLFDLPRSSWEDYDRSRISRGGGVFERSAKSVPVSAEMRACFDIQADTVTPAELMHALLGADVELLWLGGIGTYVKSTSESHADAGDRANDAIRIDATELRVKVVGEGANLGLTQRGRIQAALGGVRLNTDALDNSAGVDCSDHEVNIKILLGEVERAGEITRTQRDHLLHEMTDEVGELVLRDNDLQSQALSVAQQKGVAGLDPVGRFMRALEKEGRLDRALEFLPSDETLAERLKNRVGLTRPELAVLLAYAKIVLYDELLASSLPDDPWMAEELAHYFPRPLREAHGAAIPRHRLRREIVATVVTNAMLNRVDLTFVHDAKEKTGLPAADVARAWLAARDVFDLPAVWRQIEDPEMAIPAAVQAEMLAETSRLLEHAVLWMAQNLPRPLDVPATVASYGAGVRELSDHLDALLPESHRHDRDLRAIRYVERGAPRGLAERVAGLEALEPACDVVRIAAAAEVSVQRAAEVYYAVGEAFGFDWLHRVAARLPADSSWEKLAVLALGDDLYAHQGALTTSVLLVPPDDLPPAEAIRRWTEGREAIVERTRRLLQELETAARPDLAMVAVAARHLKGMAG